MSHNKNSLLSIANAKSFEKSGLFSFCVISCKKNYKSLVNGI